MTPQPTTLGLAPSFGFGDRIGLATPGHVLAMQRAGGPIRPIFAQQSIREMTRTGRTPRQVIADAIQVAASWQGPQGADADHLKTTQDIDRTADAGFVFFTIDPSAEVDAAADNYTPAELKRRFHALRDVPWIEAYRGLAVKLSTGTVVELTEEACMRAAVKYGRAVNLAVSLAGHIASVMQAAGRDHEIELSVDETPQPTTLPEHYIIAHRCIQEKMKLVSLAPRFIGDFEKGVDYKGDLKAFEKSLADHAALAEMLGPYKLSLHSGSDKLSVYGLLARHTRGRFHVKTAGTSYLEALRVVARHDPKLFRRIVRFAREHYEVDRESYHVSATLASAPDPEQVADVRQLEAHYLEHWADVPPGRGFTAPGRQILHCTFGSVLTDPSLKAELLGTLETRRATYDELLAEHFARHLHALRAGM